VQETWAARDLPVLEAAVSLQERSYMVTVTDIAMRTGLEASVVARALEALDPVYVDFRKTTTGGDPRFWYVYKVTAEARRAVGQWPTAKSLVSKLAEQLASAYYRASWPDVEDDVSLCVWVRKQCGDEMTVKQAGKLRTVMEALIAKSPKVVIFVEGGVVQGCTSNDKSLLVTVIDRDNFEEEENKEEAEAEAFTGTEDCVHDVY